MAKFAALSNRPTSKCQRRKEKRFKIPKVTVIKKSYHEKNTNGIYKFTNIQSELSEMSKLYEKLYSHFSFSLHD